MTSPTRGDLELLSSWREGDEAAGRELVARHISRVHRFFRSKVDLDVEDLTQRTFLKCVESRARINPRTSFRAYLLGIARHVLFEYYRGRRRDANLRDFMSISSDDLRGSPSQLVAKEQDRNHLFLALRSVPLDLQIAIELRYWEELSVPEIAEALQIPEGTVKSRLHRARVVLKKALGEIRSAPLESTVDDGDIERWAADLRELLTQSTAGSEPT